MAETKTPFKAKTRDQVKAMLEEGKSAQEIAAALNKTPATIYSHIRNLGAKPKGKRGRPRKSEGTTPATRPSPVQASSNGHGEILLPEMHEQVKDAIKRRQEEIAKLEKVLSTLEA